MKKVLTTSILAAVLLLGVPHESRAETGNDVDTWNLSHIYPSRGAWEAARLEFAAQIATIEGMTADWTVSAESMLAYLELDCELARTFFRLITYADLHTMANMDNPSYRRMTGQMLQLFGRWQSAIADTDTRLTEIGRDRIARYLEQEPALGAFVRHIDEAFAERDHALPPDQKRLLAGAEAFANSGLLAYRALSSSEMPQPKVTLADGSEHRLDYPTYLKLRGLENADDRRLVTAAYFAGFGAFQDTFAALMDGEVTRRHWAATAAGYADSLSAKLADERIDPTVHSTTIEVVRRHRDLLRRYLALKAQLAALRSNFDAELAPLAYSFDEARQMIVSSLSILGSAYTKPLNAAFDERWIDRYPRSGKKGFGGATNVPGRHPYVLLNYTGSLTDIYVATHELGHAIHFWLMDTSHPCAASASSGLTQEIAALFNEHLLSDALSSQTNEPWSRVRILERALDRMTAALFDQARLAQFEAEMHRSVADGQSLSADWLNRRYLELLIEYRGTETDGSPVIDERKYGWMDIEAFYMNHYVINYTWGSVAALALTEMVHTEGAEGAARYLEYLRNGGNDAPMALLARTGIRMDKPAPYEAAFRVYERRLGELAALLQSLASVS